LFECVTAVVEIVEFKRATRRGNLPASKKHRHYLPPGDYFIHFQSIDECSRSVVDDGARPSRPTIGSAMPARTPLIQSPLNRSTAIQAQSSKGAARAAPG
jgi:hypothetical protein